MTLSPASGPCDGDVIMRGRFSLSRLRERVGVRAARPISPRLRRLISPSPCPLPQAGEGSQYDDSAFSLSLEFWLRFLQERLVADLKILCVEAQESLVDLARGERLALFQPGDEFLVPARDERRAVGDPPRRRVGFLGDLVVRHYPRHQPLLLRLGGAEDAALEKDFQGDGTADELVERTKLVIGHDKAEPVDRRAEPAALAADAQIAQRREFQPAADADPLDERHQRMAAGDESAQRAVHDLAIGARLIGVRALRGELADVVAGAERLAAGAAQDDAAYRFVGIEPPHRLAEELPQWLRHRVELRRTIDRQRDDAAVARFQ